MTEGRARAFGLALTVGMHALLGSTLFLKSEACGGGGGSAIASNFENARTIEASLAFKKKEVKTRQPQKKKKQTFKPKVADTLSRDAELVPEKKEPDETLRPDPDEIDINSLLEKNRKQDDELSSTGSDEIPVEGADDGSEWGTEKDARGDPYVAELKGRLYAVWRVPTLETGSGTAVGCVRLDPDGTIVERELKQRSKNANLDRSVELALRESTDMEEPVPANLINLLTVEGICFPFIL